MIVDRWCTVYASTTLTTQLNSTSRSVELSRYKPGFSRRRVVSLRQGGDTAVWRQHRHDRARTLSRPRTGHRRPPVSVRRDGQRSTGRRRRAHPSRLQHRRQVLIHAVRAAPLARSVARPGCLVYQLRLTHSAVVCAVLNISYLFGPPGLPLACRKPIRCADVTFFLLTVPYLSIYWTDLHQIFRIATYIVGHDQSIRPSFPDRLRQGRCHDFKSGGTNSASGANYSQIISPCTLWL